MANTNITIRTDETLKLQLQELINMLSIKKKIVIVMCCLALSLTACQSVEKISDNTKNNVSIEISLEEKEKANAGFSNTAPIVRSDSGYYYVKNMMIYYYDIAKNESVVLCNKPNCRHDTDEECNGFTVSSRILYQSGHLYLLSLNENNENILEEVNQSTGERKTVISLGADAATQYTLCNDNIYFANDSSDNLGETSTAYVYKTSLKDGKKETVYEYTDIDCSIGTLKSYGGKVYFLLKGTEKSEKGYMAKGKGLYCIDDATGSVSELSDEDIQDYCIDYNENNLYLYKISDGLYKWNLKDNSQTRIFEADEQTLLANVSFDGNYVYMSNHVWKIYAKAFYKLGDTVEDKIWVFDSSGACISEIPIDSLNCSNVFFGDKENLFIKAKIDGKNSIYKAKKDDFNSISWEEL